MVAPRHLKVCAQKERATAGAAKHGVPWGWHRPRLPRYNGGIWAVASPLTPDVSFFIFCKMILKPLASGELVLHESLLHCSGCLSPLQHHHCLLTECASKMHTESCRSCGAGAGSSCTGQCSMARSCRARRCWTSPSPYVTMRGWDTPSIHPVLTQGAVLSVLRERTDVKQPEQRPVWRTLPATHALGLRPHLQTLSGQTGSEWDLSLLLQASLTIFMQGLSCGCRVGP